MSHFDWDEVTITAPPAAWLRGYIRAMEDATHDPARVNKRLELAHEVLKQLEEEQEEEETT